LGFLFVDLETREELLELNADLLFAPASVTKIFSCAAALNALAEITTSRHMFAVAEKSVRTASFEAT
jgi:D-alanyl-D-alanine carboxypeptidase